MNPPGPLAGVRILDMTQVVMGPYATQMMGDLGADVIKIEPPSGDTTRKITPMRHAGMGYMFLNLNRNKRSLVLDLKQPAALEAFFDLAKAADVLICNVRPKAMARLGITYDKLARANPKIISVSLVGFAQNGPYAAFPVYEDLIQGLTAIPTMLVDTGSEQPIYVPYAFNDRTVGLHAAIAVLSTLLWRERSGKGQEIEIPMFETMAQGILGEHLGGLTFEPPLGPPGYRRALSRQRRPYATRDGFVCVIIYTDKHWRAFLELIGQPRLMQEDERLRDIGTRTQHSDTLYRIIADVMPSRTTAEWLDVLRRGDIPVAPLHTIETLVADAHLAATRFLRTVEHPTEGTLRQPGVIGRWSATPPAVTRHAPRLGEHSVEVLREAGVSTDRVAQLLAAGAAVQSRHEH